jgi:hypothetical protein
MAVCRHIAVHLETRRRIRIAIMEMGRWPRGNRLGNRGPGTTARQPAYLMT